MHHTASGRSLSELVEQHLPAETKNWFSQKIRQVASEKSARQLYLAYSLCHTKFKDVPFDASKCNDSVLAAFLIQREANLVEVGRLALLVNALEADADFFVDKIVHLIQMSDSKELETILKYLVLLPEAEKFCWAAVDALRTNISTVFDAISLNNPYPSLYFNDQQWNQMYLKAVFIGSDLSRIKGVDERANEDLARIISDYAHERWAASRDVDPLIWRPTPNYLQGVLLEDMKRLLGSSDIAENRAGALCCYYSQLQDAKKLLADHQDLVKKIESGDLTWSTINS
ncbi:EboA domain-containing protein [Allomuricauda sp. SCSIO 65647]|uniref:EboA domain-containing protein n=1 Tax=Allomuricauda sp. SCSIO 65647 TaxID=2908843 RepID=UPI001F1E35DF|nr:EboA domain-containing protein [Muricauda sp. SCSIO 65647]UJH66933.1 EboA domain-containing protein [Muricauda sp. SCSIO 65647]